MTLRRIDSFEPSILTDEELLAMTAYHRDLAGDGDSGSAAAALKCEREMARRFGGATTLVADLVAFKAVRRRWLPF